MTGFLIIAAGPVFAADLKQQVAQMSAQAYALLNSLNAQSGGGKANPLLGPVASFASDTDPLNAAVSRNDMGSAAAALSAIQSDRGTIESELAAHPNALNRGQWDSLKAQLDAVANVMGKAPAAPTGTAEGVPSTVATAPPPAPPTTAPLAAASASSTAGEGAPKVVISSRERKGEVVRIHGYIEGHALKSAGIYENGQRLKGFRVSDVPGDQKVELDIGLANPTPGTSIRVTDADGRSAEASVLEPATALADEGSAPASLPGVSAPASSADSSTESGVEVDRNSRDDSPDTGNTVEIPSHGPPRRSPSRRHTLSSHLGNVQINILGVTQNETMPPTYDVVGQISGQGVARAGIYVDGRLVKRIPIEDGANYTSFDQRFVLNGGTAATIRAYGAGDQFTETSVDLGSTSGAIASAAPMTGMAPGLAVQITSVRPIAANLYMVSGVISGRSIASAGLYQNGMLVQNLNTAGGGIAGILGAVVPGTYRSVNFNARFNPMAGPATIRAFDTSGAYTEQPVVAGGAPYASPYAGANPYVNPYGSTFGVNPYGGTFGVNPYGGAPAYPYPYTAPANPYATRPGASTRPLW